MSLRGAIFLTVNFGAQFFLRFHEILMNVNILVHHQPYNNNFKRNLLQIDRKNYDYFFKDQISQREYLHTMLDLKYVTSVHDIKHTLFNNNLTLIMIFTGQFKNNGFAVLLICT